MFKWTFLACLMTGTVYGANFPTGTQIEILNDFSGGLNTTSPKHKIPKNFSPSMSNVFIHRNPGKIIKRPGFIQVGSTNTLANGRLMFTFNKENGDKEFIVSDDSMVLSTKDFQTYTFISSGLNNSVHLNACQVRNKIWFTNGINSVFTWDGTTKQILDGTNSTPNVPKFRYFVYYQERVFGGNTAANASLIQWTDVASTAGIAIAPDSFLAWPVINGLNIGQGDGSVITALWLYKGQLQIGKERSIFTIYGTNTSTYFARKTEAQAGISSNESVVVLDGLTYYKGFDGIYAYDGGTSKRISDAIVPDIDAMLDSINLVRQNSWDSQADFARGQFIVSTATITGFLTLSTFPITMVPLSGHPEITGASIILASATNITDSVSKSTSSQVGIISYDTPLDNATSNKFLGVVETISQTLTNNPIPNNSSGTVKLTIYNTATGESESCVNETQDFPIRICSFLGNANKVLFTGSQINSNFGLKAEYFSGTTRDIMFGTGTVILRYGTTGQFISDIATNATITAWGNFDSLNNANGGIINFYERTSTSIVNMTTQTWKSISPGTIINEPTQNTFFQWAATLTYINSALIPLIDNVTQDHVEGAGSRDRPFAIDWKNEYWLSIATETSGIFSKQYIKSWITNENPIAWNPLNGFNIRSFCKNGTTALYGGASSTGTFYRLDYGDNDNGLAIDGFYETPQLVLKGGLFGGLEGNWMEEQLTELWIDADVEDGNTFRLGSAFNGSSYTEETFPLTGTDRVLKILNTPSKFAKYFQWRFRNNDLGKGLGLNNFAILYIPQATR